MARFSRFSRLTPFFNREVELRGLNEATSSAGRLLLVTGPRNSGKSALMTEFAARMANDHTGTPMLINMREGTFNTAAAFARELRSKVMLPFIQATREMLTVVPTDSGLEKGAAEAFLGCAEAAEKRRLDDMTQILQELDALFYNWRVTANQFRLGRRAGIPTLIVDEANRLHEWKRDPQELDHLKTLEAFFIRITKETEVGNVILCSSEEFFRFWMQTRLGAERFTDEVVGDLVEAEAKRFFLSRLSMEVEREALDFPEDLWKDVYGYVGGRMLLLVNAARDLQWGLESQEKLWERWTVFKDRASSRYLADVMAGFRPEDLPLKWTAPGSGMVSARSVDDDLKACWGRRSYRAVLERLVNSGAGMVSQEELLESKCVTPQELDSLVMHNFVHVREKSAWAKDVSFYTGSWPAIMAPSKPHLLAMGKALLQDVFVNILSVDQHQIS